MRHSNRFLSQAATVPVSDKLAFLHKLLIGEAAFKDKTPVRLSYVQHAFGDKWQSEVSAWGAQHLDADAQAVLKRQISRLHLTKYTNRELAAYLADGGVRFLEKNAEAAQLADARAYLKAKGADELRKMLHREGKLANWTEAMTESFIQKVLRK